MTKMEDADTVLPLLPDSHPLLRRALKEIPVAEMGVRTAMETKRVLEATMRAAEGIGLAANQVGLSVRAFAMATRDGRTLTLFNPRVMQASAPADRGYEEMCLSFPGLRLEIARPREVLVAYEDETGTPHEARFRGLDAICTQHEIDHLDGIVFTSRVSRLVLSRARNRLAKERRREVMETATPKK